MPKGQVALGDVLSYADIAEQLGVSVGTIRQYATYDTDFPAPVTPKSFRSPGFSRADVQTYVKVRERRATDPAKVGGKETLEAAVNRVQLDADAGKRIRAILAERRPDATVSRMKELVALVGVSTAAFHTRMAGTSRWKRSELLEVAAAIGADVTEITGGEKL